MINEQLPPAPTNPPLDVLVVGGGVFALILSLLLHQKGFKVSIAGELPPTNPPLNPELMLIGGDDSLPPLFQSSLQGWRNLSDLLGLPPLLTGTPAQDLATSAGRVTKLREEAMLDALSGEPVTFTDVVPAAPSALGAKVWSEAPMLLPATLGLLQNAVARAAIPRQTINPAVLSVLNPVQPQLTMQDGSTITARHIIFTSARALRKVLPPLGLALPLRPARGHVLMLQTATAHGLPLTLQRLHRGHLFVVPINETRIDVHYDAINDPAQSTFNTRPSTSLVTALQQHVGRLIPVLQNATLLDTRTVRHWLTPDFLPAIGPWPGLPGVLVGTGWGGRGTAFAPGAAEALVQAVLGEDMGTSAPQLMPNRFANGLWQVVKQPGSLTWHEPTPEAPSMLSPKPEYMQNVHLTESPKVSYANNVNQIEKKVTESAARRPSIGNAKGKPRITTASVKGS